MLFLQSPLPFTNFAEQVKSGNDGCYVIHNPCRCLWIPGSSPGMTIKTSRPGMTIKQAARG